MHPDALLEGLTEPQRKAVTTVEGPLLVLAGAGSGKTRVITRRAAYVAATAARPDQVLAITFTNKAAGEMRERIYSLGVSGRMWVCTFHSLCARLLREFGHVVGVRPGFSIFDESDRRDVLREAIEACNLSPTNWRPRAIEGVISKAKNDMLDARAFAEQAYDFSAKTIARVYEDYQRRMVEQNACDFDDLLLYVARMLEGHADLREELSRRFRYLLIDEYQDTNRPQYVIARQLAATHRNICATGDPDQSIYGWRGADIHNILDFEKDYPDCVTVRLEQNYRSTPAILSAASELIRHNRQRKDKALWTENEAGPAVRLLQCEDERHEAKRIAQEIQAYCDEGGKPGDVAIVYRVNALSRVLEEALLAAKIPYQIARGVEFYNRKEIKDALAYLRSVLNPADEVSILRAINTPARGIGKTTVERVRAFAHEQGIDIGAAIERAEGIAEIKSAKKKLAPFAELMAGLRRMPRRPVQTVVEAVLAKSGLESSLREEGEIDNDRLKNVEELVSAARQYDQDNPEGSLEDWVHQISLVSDTDRVDLSGGPVTLMTLHAAKGLEFPVVYIAGLEEGLLPHGRAVDSGEESDMEEERRLFFVGITRAMRRLTLTRAEYRMIRGMTERTMVSRFTRELPSEEIEFHELEVERDRSRSHLGGQYGRDPDAEGFVMPRPGQLVVHPEYGEGRVVRIEPRGHATYIRIRFPDDGERSFALDHTTLEVVE